MAGAPNTAICAEDIGEHLSELGRNDGSARSTSPLRFSNGSRIDEHAAHVADVRAQQDGIARQIDRVRDAGDFRGVAGHPAQLAHDGIAAFQTGASGSCTLTTR